MAGPLTVNKPNPLPPELEDFVHSGGGHSGFIIASFGSYVEKIIQKEKIDVLAAAFGKLKQKVLWKLKSNIYCCMDHTIEQYDTNMQKMMDSYNDQVFLLHICLFTSFFSKE